MAQPKLRTFEIDLLAVVEALNRSTPLPLIWSHAAGELYRKSRQIFESDPNWSEILSEGGEQKYLDAGMTDGEVLALAGILVAMRDEVGNA